MTHIHDFITRSIIAIKQVIKVDASIHNDSDWINISSAFKIFTQSLIEHMNDEDSNCFSQAEEAIGCNALFYRLICDHIEIRQLIKDCQSLINSNQRTEFSILFSQLDKLVEQHSIREENLIGTKTKNLELSARRIIEALRRIHISQ